MGSGRHEISTGVGFFDHMLTAVAVHGLFDLTVQAKGDLHIDTHHTIEDVGLVLGAGTWIRHWATARVSSVWVMRYVTMDEALGFVAVDLSGRPYCRIPWSMAHTQPSGRCRRIWCSIFLSRWR